MFQKYNLYVTGLGTLYASAPRPLSPPRESDPFINILDTIYPVFVEIYADITRSSEESCRQKHMSYSERHLETLLLLIHKKAAEVRQV
jgi:hypothetical protein